MSKIFLSLLAGSVIVGCIAATGAGAATAKNKDVTAQFGVPLPANELFQLYQGRSWLWSDGAGYFSPKQRQFRSWTGSGKTASYGEGRWFIPEAGKLCFKATWTAQSGSAPAVTCFSHRVKGGNVYQKREPDGEWYLFKHAALKQGDEYAKLRKGDYVGKRFGMVKARLSEKG